MEAFGRFRLLEKIGVGGMAEIFYAEAPLPSGGVQPCVIKRMLPHLQSNPDFVDMFLTEADICTFLRHENLIEVYEAAEIDGRYYMAMELAQGFELERFLAVLRDNEIECPPALVVMIGRKLAKALDYLHRATSLAGTPLNLVHRDVNPTNVFVLDGGEVKLGDLGVARIAFLESYTSKDAPLKGKLRYLAPELLLRKPVDQRLDIYDLGLTLWELASGQRAFDLKDELKTMQAIIDGDLSRLHKLRPELPKGLVHVIEKAIAVDPSKRYESAADVYRDLRALAEHGEIYTQEQLAGMVEYAHELSGDVAAAVSAEAGEPPPPPPTHVHEKPAPKKRSRSRWLSVLVLLLLAAVTGFVVWKARGVTRVADLPPPPPQTSATIASSAPSAVAIPPANEPNIRAAFGLLKKGHAEKAAELFEHTLATHPERADVRYGLAHAYFTLGRNENAVREAETALKDRQSDPELWLMLGNAAGELGKQELMRHAYERMLFLAPEHAQAADVRTKLKQVNATLKQH